MSTEKPIQPLSALELAYQAARKPKRRIKCMICGQPEGSSGDGQPRRFLHVADEQWVCNYCNNQKPGA